MPYNSSTRAQSVIVERVALYLEFLIFILVVIALGNTLFSPSFSIFIYKMGG